MPSIDMPLEQLLSYEGRNPRPADFDRFWDESVREMHAIDPQIELRPATFQVDCADCFDLFWTGMGGARVHAKYLRPKNDTSSTRTGEQKTHPAVLQFHGYGGSSGDWNDKLGYVAAGFSVAALDVRGQAGESEDAVATLGPTSSGQIIRGLDDALASRPEKLFFRNAFLDCAQMARIVMNFPEVDASRVGAVGGSQGGGLTLACAALEPSIKKIAPTFPFLCDYQRVWEMDLAVAAYAELKTYFRHFDPRHQRESEIWTALGYIDNQHLARRIQAKTLMCVGLSDTVCPPSTQFAAYNKIAGEKNLLVYPDYGHEGLPGSNDEVFQFLSDL